MSWRGCPFEYARQLGRGLGLRDDIADRPVRDRDELRDLFAWTFPQVVATGILDALVVAYDRERGVDPPTWPGEDEGPVWGVAEVASWAA